MLTREDELEIVALYRRGWSISAISRHTGRDRKTVRAWLRGERGRRPRPPSVLEPYRAYIERRLHDDPHLDATVLLRELRQLGFGRSYPTLTRELRRLELRPACELCKRGDHPVTVELSHEPGEEIQLDWLEFRETPWGELAYALVGALSHSGQIRAVLAEGMSLPELVACLDGVLRRLGGTPRSWRTDRMATVVEPGGDRLRAEFAEVAKHYGVTVAVCPARRAQRKGVVETSIRYLRRSWWRTAQVTTAAEAQASLDRWCVEIADARRRGKQTVAERAASEPLLPLPPLPYPAELEAERLVGRSALVSFEGNRYSVPPAFVGQRVWVRHRLGEPTLRIVSAACALLATHRRLPPGGGQLTRQHEHALALERAVLAAFTTKPPCRRKANRPPSAEALRLAATLAPGELAEPEIPSLERYAELAGAR